MGWNNPPIPWKEFERRLSWGSNRADGQASQEGARVIPLPRRPPVDGPEPDPPGATSPAADGPAWAELHCHSSYSFLDGASDPDALVAEAVRLGVEALAVTDHDGMYGVARLAEAAREVGLKTVFGAELSLGLFQRQNGVPDPEGSHLLVLARRGEGYGRLASAITTAQMRGGEGQSGLRSSRIGECPRRPLGRSHRLPQGRSAGSSCPRRAAGGRA